MKNSNKETSDSVSRSVSTQLQKNQAITDVKLENLAAEVAKHNRFAERVPILEEKVKNIEEDIKEIKAVS